jgi:hypothetical protein
MIRFVSPSQPSHYRASLRLGAAVYRVLAIYGYILNIATLLKGVGMATYRLSLRAACSLLPRLLLLSACSSAFAQSAGIFSGLKSTH